MLLLPIPSSFDHQTIDGILREHGWQKVPRTQGPRRVTTQDPSTTTLQNSPEIPQSFPRMPHDAPRIPQDPPSQNEDSKRGEISMPQPSDSSLRTSPGVSGTDCGLSGAQVFQWYASGPAEQPSSSSQRPSPSCQLPSSSAHNPSSAHDPSSSSQSPSPSSLDIHPSFPSGAPPLLVLLPGSQFADCLHVCVGGLAMAGTATEQLVGLGKPVVTIPGQGPQFNFRFAEAQQRLLGKSVRESDPGLFSGPSWFLGFRELPEGNSATDCPVSWVPRTLHRMCNVIVWRSLFICGQHSSMVSIRHL